MKIAVIYFQPYRRSEENESTNDDKDLEILNEGKKHLSRKYLILFVFLICLLAGIQLANEYNAVTFISTYLQRSELKLDEKTAAYCQGYISTAITVGRILNLFLTIKISSQTMLFINYFFMILGNCLIMTIGTYSLQGVYVGCCLLGYGFSNCFPMMIAFVDERITINNKIMSLMNFSATILLTGSPILLGRFLDTNPSYFIVLNLIVTSSAFVFYILLVILEGLRLTKRI